MTLVTEFCLICNNPGRTRDTERLRRSDELFRNDEDTDFNDDVDERIDFIDDDDKLCDLRLILRESLPPDLCREDARIDVGRSRDIKIQTV